MRFCPARFHLQDVTVEEAEAIPMNLLHPLLEAWQPHTHTNGEIRMWWNLGRLHRDYDLPAVIYDDGTLAWYNRNQVHRAGGKPAVILPNGEREWWVRGRLVSSDNTDLLIF